MRHKDAAKGATLCGILEGWDQAIGEVLSRPSSIDEDVVLAALDQKHTHMGFQDLWYELNVVPHSVQVRCDKIELCTLDSIRPFIGMMHEGKQSSCNDCQEAAGQENFADPAHAYPLVQPQRIKRSKHAEAVLHARSFRRCEPLLHQERPNEFLQEGQIV